MGARFPVVLVDDGELDDVRDLLLELGVEFAHLRGGAVPRRIDPPSDVFVSTLRRAQLARDWPHAADGALRPVRIAVAEEDSPTARSGLRRMGFSYLVRPPIHRVAMRLLLLRALYHGEERRADARVPVGVDVSVRAGMRRRDALLADLSRRGCRLVTDRALQVGARITVNLPETLVGEERLALVGRVLRCDRDPDALFEGGFTVAVQFASVAAEDVHRLERLLTRRGVWLGPGDHGPRVRPLYPQQAAEAAEPEAESASAAIGSDEAPTGRPAEPDPGEPAGEAVAATPAGAGGTSAEPPPRARETGPADGAVAELREEPPAPAVATAARGNAPAEPDEVDEDDGDDAAAGPRLGASLIGRSRRRAPPPDRRRHPRAVYERRVLAQASAAMHRMLLGRDVGVGGMRVDPHPDLRVGSTLRVALFDTTRAEPLIVEAVVARDDGRHGLALQFLKVDPEVAARIEAMVATLPPIERLGDGEAGALGTVVGEIVS